MIWNENLSKRIDVKWNPVRTWRRWNDQHDCEIQMSGNRIFRETNIIIIMVIHVSRSLPITTLQDVMISTSDLCSTTVNDVQCDDDRRQRKNVSDDSWGSTRADQSWRIKTRSSEKGRVTLRISCYSHVEHIQYSHFPIVIVVNLKLESLTVFLVVRNEKCPEMIIWSLCENKLDKKRCLVLWLLSI